MIHACLSVYGAKDLLLMCAENALYFVNEILNHVSMEKDWLIMTGQEDIGIELDFQVQFFSFKKNNVFES